MEPEVVAMVTCVERQVRCMGSVLEQDPRGIIVVKKGGPDPRMLTLPRGLRSLAEAHNGKPASVSHCPGLARFEGGCRNLLSTFLRGSLGDP